MDQVTFLDVIQKSFIAMSMGSADRITTLNIIINVSMSFVVGMFIFYIYKKTYHGVLYQWSFNISLVLSCAVTSLVIMTISGNLVLSLGMVGALSIVRFRTPVKDSIDLVFLFWAISVGIANGVGYYNISVVGSAMLGIFLLISSNKRGKENSYLLVLQLPGNTNEEEIFNYLQSFTSKLLLKSKTVSDSSVELTIEVELNSQDSQFIDDLVENGKAIQATLVAFEQEYSSV